MESRGTGFAAMAGLVELCAAFDRVELWLDPAPNDQLLGLQSLAWLGDRAAILEKLYVVHADGRLGERPAPHPKTLNATVIKVGRRELETAAAAWRACCQPTPSAWFALLDADIDALPFLRKTIALLLGELPAIDTGSRCDRTSCRRPRCAGRHRAHALLSRARALSSSDSCRAASTTWSRTRINIFATDRARFPCPISGIALHAGKADFARDNPIHRWWGGTLLTDDRLRRWDASTKPLVAPR